MKWYVVHTYSGQENSVKKHLEMVIEREGAAELFGHILVPSQDVVNVSRGKKVTRNRKFFPSYIVIEMEMNKQGHHIVTNIPGVTHFLGDLNKPQAIRKSEVDRLLGQVDSTEQALTAEDIPYVVGNIVRIKEGPFKDFDGNVEDVNIEKGKLKVMVSVFGRSTPVELGFRQVELVS
jgi:transcription termination/antitermination protein NusG